MKKLILPLFLFLSAAALHAQPSDDVKTMHENARNYMKSGDFNNAILVLNRAMVQDKDNLDLMKDLAMSYYYKRDYAHALEVSRKMLDRDDADVVTYQIAGNVYKALEMVKDADRMYKKGLRKFPKSGPLYSEYGELLSAAKDNTAIDYWEKGIEADPAFSGNYYNAALYYFYTTEKVWNLIYGEIFVNMESLSERGTAMKELLYKGYKEKLFEQADLLADQGKNKNEFSRAFLNGMQKQSVQVTRGINIETLIGIRSRFILDWYANQGANSTSTRFPYKLFEQQRQLLQNGMFEAYNQWLFGAAENLAAYDNWTRTHADQFASLNKFLGNRVFRMPANQYYHGN